MDPARIRYLLRRGMKELDVLFTRYHAQRYAEAPADERAAFEQLLDGPQEPQILAWALGQEEPPAEFAAVIAEFRRYRRGMAG